MKNLNRSGWAARLTFTAIAACFAAGAMAAEYKERTLKLGHVIADDHPAALGAKRWAELLTQKSDGKIKVRIYGNGAIGGDTQMTSALQGGVQELGIITSSPMASVVREVGLIDLPFTFNSAAEVDAVLAGKVGDAIASKMNDKGLVILGWMENGFRSVTNSRAPITKFEDMQGLKIRVLQNPVYIETFNALGANAVPMPFPEVYTALESRAVDGQENPLGTINTSKFNEVQKYLSVTRHTYTPYVAVVSKRVWDRLSPDEQTLLRETAAEASAYQRQISRESEAKFLAELKERGMEVNELSPEEAQRMREKLKPVIDKFSKELGGELGAEMFAEIAAVRGKSN
ncbi:TRAP transporter substrate-binding protein [Bordetella muralis]|jgi:TRAP-type transport system periplasmic protein|uniref:TRAP transporter substrate-binding protein n=1 Tax=Bordetella muralis TaxID=1649130 RepID=UPI0039EF95CF